jgi:uncharacterized protein (DUF362 family)
MKKGSCLDSLDMDRRKFLKLLVIASAGAFIPQSVAQAASKNLIEDGPTKVCLTGVKNGSGDHVLIEAVKNAARAATDFSWLSRGDSVFIKPALNSGNPYPATTNPEGIGAVVELLKEKGAGNVIVSDMSGIEHVKLSRANLKGSSRELMNKSGMAKAALEAGAELYFPEEEGWNAFFEDEPIDSANWSKGIMMPTILKKTDHIILMPRCGRHILLGSSLGMKNAVGYWRTDSRLEYHKYASTIQEKTADANTVKTLRDKQRLVLTVGTKVLTTFGPDKGFISAPETGLVIASENIVAHDMVSLAWLLKNRFGMSEEEEKSSKDPYKKQFVVSTANRAVVKLLGGFGDALNAQKLVRNDLNSIWDDRVLNRAYDVFGGVPKVDLVDIEDSVPRDMKKQLSEMVSKPNQKA